MATKLTPYQEDVYAGKVCPYCKGKTKLMPDSYVYNGRSYGNQVMVCGNYPYCDSYVGTHKEDNTALGRLANKELRTARKEAHKHFDLIWKEKLVDRDDLYYELSEELGIDLDHTHIGWFGKKNCYNVVEWAKAYYKRLVDDQFKNEES